MFNNVLWFLASRATISVAAAGIGDKSAEISDVAAGIVDIAVYVIPY